MWRYPVKSVGGERLTAATVGVLGVEGDRVIAVHDERDDVTWAGAIPPLMRVRAVAAGAGVAELILPGGERFRTDAPDADSRLSAAVHAKVTLVGHRPDRTDAAVHVLTTTALHSLGSALPDSTIDVTRFRPNLVLDGVPDESGTGYPEHGWIGRRMAIGALRLRFTEGCDRCVMITKETPTVPHDRAVLRWVARELGNTLGVYATVEAPGDVRVGDEARWLD
jgi:uncharacterized protein YcbX